MTGLFRVILIISSLSTWAMLNRRIRRSKASIESTVFWMLLSAMLVVFALFPVVPDTIAHLLGIYSTANFLFLFIIFLLLIRSFLLSMELGRVEEQLKTLVQELSLDKRLSEEKKEEESK